MVYLVSTREGEVGEDSVYKVHHSTTPFLGYDYPDIDSSPRIVPIWIIFLMEQLESIVSRYMIVPILSSFIESSLGPIISIILLMDRLGFTAFCLILPSRRFRGVPLHKC